MGAAGVAVITKCMKCGAPLSAEHVLLPREPPWEKMWVATGTRTENDIRTDVVLEWTDEGGGWHQWAAAPGNPKQFKTAAAAAAAGRSCPGPTFYMPHKATIHAEPVDSRKAAKYRAMIAEVEAECAK